MMVQPRCGVWLIGAQGGVATTTVVGLAALQRGLSDETALVSALPKFADVEFANWSDFVIGGHEVRDTTYAAEAQYLYEHSRVFSPALLAAIAPELAAFDQNIRPGTLLNVGKTIESLAGETVRERSTERPLATLERVQADLKEFKTRYKLKQVIVVNLASTEPPPPPEAREWSWAAMEQKLTSSAACPIAASSLYAAAAMLAGCDYVNFTPSCGSDLPALCELALREKVLHVGRDGKTGETLLKSVLAPMFAARNLRVLSWVGHNIFGNMDGKVLDDPVNKANKVRSKDHLLTEILGYKPNSLVSIEYLEDLADWKTAWDHIHFRGFLDTHMTLQFTWQGCDSLLAAPLVLDLIRFTEREHRRGTSGVMEHLASFFKSPMGTDVPPEFARQYQLLERWADDVSSKGDA